MTDEKEIKKIEEPNIILLKHIRLLLALIAVVVFYFVGYTVDHIEQIKERFQNSYESLEKFIPLDYPDQ